MNCKKVQFLMCLYIADDPALTAKERLAFAHHLRNCQECAKEYGESRFVIDLAREHWQVSEDTLALIKKANKYVEARMTVKEGWEDLKRRIPELAQHEKLYRYLQLFRRVRAIAACLAIGVSILLAFSYLTPKFAQKSAPEQVVFAPKPSIKVELISDNNKLIIPSGHEIAAAKELKTLIINDKHRMVMNASTSLSINPFDQNGRFGCIVKLTSGEIFTNVEHDGNPFIVSTTHGKAVITGTTFNVKVTDVSTILVVTEGTVQFESARGGVEVASGQISKIIAHSAPASPVSCNADELTAWATAYELKPAPAKIQSIWDDYDLTDLGISAISGSIELERINYETWIEEKRAWFEREFPWTAQLRNALTAEGIEADYPELLMSSGDIWQFVYPPAGQDRLLAADDAAIIKAADHHGKNVQWLKDKYLIPVARTTTDRQKQMKDVFTLWQNGLAAAVDSREEVPRELLLDSLHACAYLRQTRSLVWLAVEAGRYSLPDMPKAQLQALLQAEVTAANRGVNDVIRLLATERSMLLCDNDLYRQLVRRLCEAIVQMTQMEERLADEIADRHP